MGPEATSQAILESIGIDAICGMIMDGRTLTRIAEESGSSKTVLLRWLRSDPDRSARAREARAATAAVWDEMAEHRIETAGDEFELKKAKELAHHYRWRASKIAPGEYGDKASIELTGKDGAPVELITRIAITGVEPGNPE